MKRSNKQIINTVYDSLMKHHDDVHAVGLPQEVGFLTPYYKTLTHQLKSMPWPLYFVLSVGLVIGIALLFGSRLPLLTSILQRGF